ncbi:nucleoporin NDC1-like [Oscarella lobularis]|uniref:nucleoporin NDC1-like n=1 Tax=Oscarella lobularis TaxID=121494 RepID=UPI003313E583
MEHYRSVRQWRFVGICGWVVVLSPIPCVALTFLSHWSLFHPIAWIQDSLGTILSANFVAFCSLFGFLAAFSTFSFSWIVRAKPQVYSTRLERWICPFIGFKLISLLLHTLCGALYAKLSLWLFLPDGFIETQSLAQFYVRYCSWMGVYVFTNEIWRKGHCLSFPSLKQRRLFRIRNGIKETVYDSLITSMKALRIFLPFHFIAGFRFPVLAIGFWDLCSLSFLQILLSHGFILSFIWSLGRRIYTVFSTHDLKFPIIAKFDHERNRLLTTALGEERDPLLQQLAYSSLSSISEQPGRERKQIFSLSQPGGVPKIWQAVSKECLKLMDNLTEKLGGRPSGASQTFGLPTPDIPQLGARTPGWSNVSNVRPRSSVHGVKAWAMSPGNPPVIDVGNRTAGESWLTARSQLDQAPADLASTPPHTIFGQLKSRPIFAYFAGPLPHAEKQTIFSGCQCHIWAVEALTHLVVASYTEDDYGVVQKDLAKIVSSLLSLLQSVEEHTRLTLAALRSQSGVNNTDDLTLRYGLKSALRRGLAAIAITFKRHLKDFDFSSEQLNRLSVLADF